MSFDKLVGSARLCVVRAEGLMTHWKEHGVWIWGKGVEVDGFFLVRGNVSFPFDNWTKSDWGR